MISKIKQLTAQEWTILILFIISIFAMIAVVEWSGTNEDGSAYTDYMETDEVDMITYNRPVSVNR